MIIIALAPGLLAALLLAAHFLRHGAAGLALLCLVMPALLLVRHRYAALAYQVFLLIGGIIWLVTGWELVQERLLLGAPWIRLAVIMAVVAGNSFAALLLFRLRSLRERYASDRSGNDDEAEKV